MSENQRMEGHFSQFEPDPNVATEGIASPPSDPLELKIEDKELIRIVDQRITDSRDFFDAEYDLYERRKKNEMYRFGRQIRNKEKEKLIKDYESKFMDNVLYEIEGTIKPLVMTRLPDLMVIPGNDSEQSVLMAQEVSKAIDTQIKERENRQVLGLASQHLPVYFTAVIKVVWNPEIDDYEFLNVHPDLVDVDHTATSNDADKMSFISQIVPLTVQEVMMRFPKKKDEFLEQLRVGGLMAGENPSWTLLATTINIREVWFTEYIKHSDTETERVEGVLWKYKECILHKMKNPNFDYEGEQRYFAYDTQESGEVKRGLNEEELNYIMMTGQIPPNVKEEQVYHNYFKFPRKPFYFFGYDQWGKIPYDETSRIEQNLANQEAVDKRGKQLEETLDKRGHNVFSKESGLTPADIEELDMNDPDEDLVVEGDPNATHKFIPPERPAPQEFEEMTNLRNRMYAVSHSNAVRGQIQTSVATTNQIAREGDFTAADDLAENTINAAAQWMADWSMQFMKLRYTKDHFRYILGVAGDVVYIKLNRNMIDEGMIVRIKASGTDKIRAQNNAMEMAKLQMIDPFTFFTDMGLSDPEGRTEKLILAKVDPVAYLQKVVKGLNTSEALAQALMNVEQKQLQQNTAMLPQIPPTMGGAPQVGMPQNPTVTNTGAPPVSPPVNPPTANTGIL